MREVDNLLNQGFQFQSITLEKYENIYKKEILDICNFNYQLDTDTESKILNILEIFNVKQYLNWSLDKNWFSKNKLLSSP